MLQKENNNTPDCANHSFYGLDYLPYMTGFIFNTMKEIWKDIKGYEGYYQISNLGRVKSLNRIVPKGNNSKQTVKEKIKKPNCGTTGYPAVNLFKNNKSKGFFIHRLIAIYFIPNPKDKPEVNHKDGNKENHLLDNLEWVTRKENCIHAYNTGLTNPKCPTKGKFGKDHHGSIIVYQFTKDNKFINKYYSASEAKRMTNIDKSNILSVCNGVRKSAGGYIWKYNN